MIETITVNTPDELEKFFESNGLSLVWCTVVMKDPCNEKNLIYKCSDGKLKKLKINWEV